jgi:hypothetical protein
MLVGDELSVAEAPLDYDYDRLGNIDRRVESGTTYEYSYGIRPQAVMTLTQGVNTDTFGYDANGNMISRTVSGGTFFQEAHEAS